MKEGIVEILDDWFFSRMTDVHTILPGIIVTYSGHKERKASVELQIKYRTKAGRLLKYPVIENVPVMFPSSSDFSLVYPLKRGDGCLVGFAETGIGTFLDKTEVSESDSPDRFSLSDAVCLPGLWSFPSVPTPPENDTDFFITFKNTSFTLDGNDFKINGDSVNLKSNGTSLEFGGNSKNFVTHAELDSALQTFMNALNIHTHPTAATGPPSPPTVPMSLNIATAKANNMKTGG